jgi:hypothetical protein
LRHVQRLPAVVLSNTSRSLYQLQDRVARFVELVAVCIALGSTRKWDHIRLVIAADLTMHH